MGAPKGHPAYNVNGEGGRPKKYTDEFIEKEADALDKWRKVEGNIFIEYFCLERNYHDSRIYEFIEINKRFAETYNLFKIKQRVALFEGGLDKTFAHPMCALLLSHNHDIYQKSEQKITGSITDPLHCIVERVSGETKDLVQEDDESE